MKTFTSWLLIAGAALASGCSSSSDDTVDLDNRAYIVSRESGELTVIDLATLTVAARVPTGGITNHMAEVSGDRTKVYVSSTDTNEIIVIDARTLTRIGTIEAGLRPTHLSIDRGGRVLAVMNEDANSVSFIDTQTDREVAEVTGFATPHFIRFAADGKTAYVANISAHHISVVDLEQYAIVDNLVLEGFAGPPQWTPAEDETGFADAQIAPDGLLYAAHARTGRVLVYDTKARAKVAELAVGTAPWVAFAEHPFDGVALKHLVTNLGDATVSLIDGTARSVSATLPGDPEAYGVNVSPLAPDRAYVMNRVRGDIAVVDTSSGTLLDRIPVGGNTETAATSADGRYVVAAVSGADRAVVLDAETGTIAATLDNVGKYPWSVTIPFGQNYCH